MRVSAKILKRVFRLQYDRLQSAVLPPVTGLSPSEGLAAKALCSVLIILLLCLGLWFAFVLPFFVARKLSSAAICAGVCAALALSGLVLHRARVRLAIWIFTITLWAWAAVTALLSGGIRSVALLGFLPGFVTAATLLGEHVATLSCGVFLGFALMLALLDMAGIHLPNYFPFPPLTIWAAAVLTAVVVALPLNQLLRFLRDSIDLMRRQLKDLEIAAQGLRESEARNRVILESARDGIVLADAESGKILGVNPAAEGLSGGCEAVLQELLMTHLKGLATRKDAVSLELGASLTEAVLTREDGACIPVELAANIVPGENGRKLLVGVFRDTSERKSAEMERMKLEDRLQQAERLETVGRLAGGVAHDFNNLLTVINGFTGLILGRINPTDENRSALEQIRNAGDRAANLTQQLLAFSRKQIIEPRPLDLNAFVKDVRPMLQSLLSDDIELSLSLGSSLPAIMADPGQMHQILMNLAANARDAMPMGGKLILETSSIEMNGATTGGLPDAASGSYVQLSITDTGTGMPKEVRAHLFEPFFTTKGVGKGTGLGLSTVYGIVQQNRGSIAVASEPGKGTTFQIYLPAATREAPAAETASAADALLPGLGTILVVEDQDNVRRLTAEILRAQGYQILEATNGQEALNVAARHSGPIHLILTDVVMPGITGPDVARQLQSVRPAIKVIFMSGYAEEVLARRGVSEGSIIYIAKPFTPAALVSKVREVLD